MFCAKLKSVQSNRSAQSKSSHIIARRGILAQDNSGTDSHGAKWESGLRENNVYVRNLFFIKGNRNYTLLNCKKWIFKINNEDFSFHLLKPVISSLNWFEEEAV